jgi:hypothetical protein
VRITRRYLLKIAAWGSATAAGARTSPTKSGPSLILNDGEACAPIVVSANAGTWERRAADDLAKYMGLITGRRPQVLHQLPIGAPAIVVGSAALAADPALEQILAAGMKPNPVTQSDAILIRRSGERLYVLGSNDESHYFAMSWILQHWGCRWYMPGAFGEHVPDRPVISVDAVDHLYAPPFEIRHYWLSWNGEPAGADDFRHRNYMSFATMPGAAQALDTYTAALAPKGSTHFNVPFADPATAQHIADRVDAVYAAGQDISLSIADGLYVNEDPRDRALIGEYDRFMLRPSLTDAMLTLYNNVARTLRGRHPDSRSKIGGLAYANVTLPPRVITTVEPNIVMWIAPIDIDPNHPMDDLRSPPRRAYRQMLSRWINVVKGRLAIYDYDQSMLVWRDLPNPSHQVFARDAKLYRAAGIAGIGTESRGAFATTFLNLFFRGQLMWNPDADVSGLLDEFYSNFYGPAMEPMRRYWSAIFSAWESTAVTEHEYPVIPAIYTPSLVDTLRRELADAEALTAESQGLLAERMRFTRLSFKLIAAYMKMVSAAASDGDYAGAVVAGEEAISARLELAHMNPIFTVHVLGPEAETPAGGAMWLPGEVQQYRNLALLTNGANGSLLTMLPLVWSFRTGRPGPPEASHGSAASNELLPSEGLDAALHWQQVRTDLYLQAQGVLAENEVSALGEYWYRCDVRLSSSQAKGTLRLMFPGLFNEAWLYINGQMIAHRAYREPWWQTDYRFEWDTDVSGKLREGVNNIVLRGYNPHHFAGIFRRPFLYRPTDGRAAASAPS